MRELQVTRQFKQEFSRLLRPIQQEANGIAQILRRDPLNPELNPKQLIDVPGNQYRVRLGEFRLVYSFTPKTLLLLAIAHRSNVYCFGKKE